jgi:anti-anti-sigma regulatory factor
MSRSYTLPALLDAVAAAPLRQALLALQASPLTVDASQVERLSTPSLQVLMAAALSWKAAGHDFAVTGESETFASIRGLLGITPDLLPSGPRA